jgi:hypothetical protein
VVVLAQDDGLFGEVELAAAGRDGVGLVELLGAGQGHVDGGHDDRDALSFFKKDSRHANGANERSDVMNRFLLTRQLVTRP